MTMMSLSHQFLVYLQMSVLRFIHKTNKKVYKIKVWIRLIDSYYIRYYKKKNMDKVKIKDTPYPIVLYKHYRDMLNIKQIRICPWMTIVISGHFYLYRGYFEWGG